MSIFRQHAAACAFPTDESWVILSPIEAAIKRKIAAVGTPLQEWDIHIYRGVLTGCNEAFIIPTARRDEILAACRDEAERERTAELISSLLTINGLPIADGVNRNGNSLSSVTARNGYNRFF